MDRHPTAAALQEFVDGGLPADRLRGVTAHVLRGCKACGKVLTRLALGGAAELPLPPPQDYDEALDRAYATVRVVLPRISALRWAEKKKGEALALLAAGGVESLEAAPPDLRGLPLFEALLERSWALRDENPDHMVELARCAALLADKLRAVELGAKNVADLRCRAWVELANAYRVAGDLDQAETALERATSHFLLGRLDDLLLGARFFTVLASQYMACGSFPMACAVLGVVAGIYQHLGDRHLAGRVLIRKGVLTGYQGDAEAAVCSIEAGLSLVEEGEDPGLVSAALLAQARFLADRGRFRAARRALWELRRRTPKPGGRLYKLKIRWLEGHIFAGLGDLDRAEQALVQAKEGFETAGVPFKAALAGLELGSVLLRRGRVEEAAAIVLECTGAMLSLDIACEPPGSLLLLHEAGKRRKLTLALLESVIAPLRQLDRQQALGRLQPAAAR